MAFQNFCPYTIDLEYYKDIASHFEVSEWIDVLLGAIDYNASGYQSEEEKLTMLTRLLPFVEKRLNLIELAPKETGKSYLYGRVSRFGWLSSGGTAAVFCSEFCGFQGGCSVYAAGGGGCDGAGI